jgi:hypothetical protein
MARKTVDVESLIAFANGYLATDHHENDFMKAERQAVCTFLEFALMKAKRYRGFNYLDERTIKNGLPGIRLEGNYPSFENTDCTRRRYM